MVLTTLAITSGVLALRKRGRNRRAPLVTQLTPAAPRPPSFSELLNATRHKLAQQLAPERLLPAQAQTLLVRADEHYQWLIHNTVDRIFGDQYEKHLRALGGTALESTRGDGRVAIPPLVKKRNRQAGYAGVSLVLALSGAPPLVLTAFAINLYLGTVMIQIGLNDMRQKRKITARGRNMIVYLGTMLSGYLAVQSAALMLTLLFEKLIATVQGESHERLVSVFGELPQTVYRLEGGAIVPCALTAIQAGDIVVVHAGELIPVDGAITAGQATIDQHALTGEAQPIEKEAGDTVLASTLVLMGQIQIQVTQANADTLVAQVTDILNKTRSHHTQVGLRGLQLADNFILLQMGLGLVALPFWGVSTMIGIWSVSLGSMLMATTPLVLMAYLDFAARNNVLVKDGRSLELLGTIDTVVFDKTGTLTMEQPTVCAIHRCGALGENDLLALAAAIEHYQAHPIAAAIRAAATAQALSLPQVDETRIAVGYGLSVTLTAGPLAGRAVRLGSQRYMALSNVAIPVTIQLVVDAQQAAGHLLVYLAVDDELQGVIELQPTVRPEAQAVIDALHQRGIELAMITGDQEAPAQALATTVGIDRVFANVLPEEKAQLVEALQNEGRSVMFVGDGINDSIALKRAHVSVSIMGATTVATDTAQIVLMDGTLAQLDTLFELSARYEKDLRAQYVLGVHVPIAGIGGMVTLGWGIVQSYVIGYAVFLTAIGLAFRPIWRQERLDQGKIVAT